MDSVSDDLHSSPGDLVRLLPKTTPGPAAHLLRFIEPQLRVYRSLAPSDRTDLIRFAQEIGIDLPGDPQRELWRVLAALARLGQAAGHYWSDAVADYRALSLEEGQQLAREIIRLWRAHPEVSSHPTHHGNEVPDVLWDLACMVPGSLRGGHEAFIEAGIFYPAELYQDADAQTRDHLIRSVETPPHRREVLGPLAQIGDEVVQTMFHRWRQSPPDWDSEIGGRINEYFLRDAGWELTETGGRRDLFHRDCFRIIPVNEAPAGDLLEQGEPAQLPLFPEFPGTMASGPVGVITPHGEACRRCGQPLVTLFDLNLRDPRLSFVAPGWRRLRIAMCDRCTLFGTLFTEVGEEGGSHWSRLNVRPEYIGTEEHGWRLPQRRLVLGPRRRSPLEARARDLFLGRSQIGGYPTWEQGNSHPCCLICGRWMVFVGQVETSEVLGGCGEGFTYAFLRQDCRLAATTYEQT